MQNTSSQRCQIKHFIIGDCFKLSGCRYKSRVCRIYTIYICINLTCICMKCRSKSHSSGIRAPSSQRGIIIILIHSLESCYDNNLSVFQFSSDSFRINLFQAGITIGTGCLHRHLKSIQRNGPNTQFSHRHCHQRY